ncbi:MAG: UDP-glucose 4-epimerase GalE [Lysobacteraceae bacterium]|nr:MAG: UDP-glucose 4-epimerase GalE [Xanthomonadaceae bacterium]
MNNRILVTGGAGYIGSHACKALQTAGYEPVVFDNLIYGHPWAVKWGPLIRGDLADPQQIEAALDEVKPAAVMHFAAYAYVGESVTNPAKYYRNNVVGSLNLLDAMRNRSIESLVFSSTCASYGIPRVTPIDESHPQNPINPYGRSKLMIEQAMADYSAAYGLRCVALRYFNAAGADPEAEIGEDHSPETHLIPLVLMAAAGIRDSITVFGRDYDTDDGTCVRDYVHVSDLAQAHVLALQALDQGAESAVYNLGNGTGFSVQQVIDACQRVTGRPIKVVDGPRRAGDPPRLVGDASKIINDLGWSPRYADLDTIVETAWNWTRHHFK